MLDEQFTASTNAETFLDLDLLPAFKKELKPRKVVGSKRGQGGIALGHFRKLQAKLLLEVHKVFELSKRVGRS